MSDGNKVFTEDKDIFAFMEWDRCDEAALITLYQLFKVESQHSWGRKKN